MLLATMGKGGAGKSVVTGTLARVLARRGRRVLVLDSDPLPGITYSLGAQPPEEAPLTAAVEPGTNRRWKYVDGVGAVRAVQRYATDAPDGVRVLQIPKTSRENVAQQDAAVNAFYMTVQRLQRAEAFREWVILGDLPAGARQIALGWAPYAEHVLLVVEPTWQSMLTARRIARVAALAEPSPRVSLVVSKATGEGDERAVSDVLRLPVLEVVPADEDVREAERAGVAVLDYAPECAAVRAIERLADRLEAAHGPRAMPKGAAPPTPCGCGAPPRERRRSSRPASPAGR